uniref:Uncharacterized protein n=1 Tax=Arion vulgaris TaxID=1028688 RepID=A0A0B7B9C3_9EUPU
MCNSFQEIPRIVAGAIAFLLCVALSVNGVQFLPTGTEPYMEPRCNEVSP